MCSKKDPTTRKQSVSSQKLVKEHMAIQIFLFQSTEVITFGLQGLNLSFSFLSWFKSSLIYDAQYWALLTKCKVNTAIKDYLQSIYMVSVYYNSHFSLPNLVQAVVKRAPFLEIVLNFGPHNHFQRTTMLKMGSQHHYQQPCKVSSLYMVRVASQGPAQLFAHCLARDFAQFRVRCLL